MLKSLWGKFAARRAQRDADLDRELQAHLDLETEDRAVPGTTPAPGTPSDDARYAARRAFGNVTRTKEDVREAWGFAWFDRLVQDSRYGLRQLRRTPGFAAVVILTIALGVGATTAVFSVVNAVLIRSLPYGDPGRLVYVVTPNPRFPQVPLGSWGPSNADFLDIQRLAHSFSHMAVFDSRKVNLAGGATVDRVDAAFVSGDFFSTLEAAPEIGRAIQPGDDQPGHESVAVISHEIWQSRFGGDAVILTKSALLDGKSHRIIGVMPARFHFPRGSDTPDASQFVFSTGIWVPLALTPQQRADRDDSSSDLIARLRPGVSRRQAQAELAGIVSDLDSLHDPKLRGFTAATLPFLDTVIGDVRPLMLLLLGSVAMVLLIACGNTANLLLARAAARAREISVRAALGAARSRLVRQMLTEALLLAGTGGALGLALAYAAIRLLLRLNPGNISRFDETSLDARVLLFTLGVSVLTGLAFGVLPALAASKTNLIDILNHGSTRITPGASPRLRATLIVAEVALAVVLLFGSGLLIRSYVKLQAVDPGFAPSTFTMEISLDARYAKREQRLAFYRSLLDRASSMPSIRSAGAITYLPFSGTDSLTLFTVENYPNQKDQLVDSRAITPHYFEAMGTPLIEGRFFTDADSVANPSGSASSPVAPSVVIVNQAFADIYYAGRNPVGQHFRYRDFGTDDNPWSTVVGVVANVRHTRLDEPPRPQVYTPLWQSDSDRAFFAFRTAAPPHGPAPDITSDLRVLVRQLDPTVAAANIHTMDDRVSESNARRRFQTLLLSLFAASALVLALVGLYALMSYTVRQRTAEIGVRMALGATQARVLGMVLKNGVALVLVGLAFGLAGAFALRQLLASWLFGIAATDPVTFAAIAVLVIAVALAASAFPARRASLIDPAIALRHE
jgi:predicted permease